MENVYSVPGSNPSISFCPAATSSEVISFVIGASIPALMMKCVTSRPASHVIKMVSSVMFSLGMIPNISSFEVSNVPSSKYIQRDSFPLATDLMRR